jgi:hypothetical protein
MKFFSYSVFCLAMQMNLAECTDLQTNGNPLQMIQRYIFEVHIHELQVTQEINDSCNRGNCRFIFYMIQRPHLEDQFPFLHDIFSNYMILS